MRCGHACRGRRRRPCTAITSCWTEPRVTLFQVATTAQSVADICAAARDASRVLARLDGATRDAALHAMADALEARTDEILEANARDIEAGEAAEIGSAALDRGRGKPGGAARARSGVSGG